jgi:hypothetical protein
MPLNNGLTLAAKNCDIEIMNAAGDVYGFPVHAVTIPEDRASKLAESTGETAPTIKSAGPFETMEITDWSYGYGQTSMDRVEGGVAGMGGNPAQYFYGDCFTLRPGKLLPGMSRDMVYNTIAGQMTPISSGVGPLGGDEQEVPRGVLPHYYYQAGYPQAKTTFTASAAVSITQIRVLVKFENPFASGTVTINADIWDATFTSLLKNFNVVINLNTIGNYTSWKWITLTAGAALALANGTTYGLLVRGSDAAILIFGIFPQTHSGLGITNLLQPYFQLVNPTGSVPFKYWANPLQKVEQLLNGSTYVNAAITAGAYFNTAATATAGTAGTSPERTFTGAICGSLVFNNNLYIGATGVIQTQMFTPAQVATNAAATGANTTTAFSMGPSVAHGGLIYGVGGNTTQVFKWTGAFPIATGSISAGVGNWEIIISPNNIGDIGTNITNLAIFQGSLYIFKPEGLFKIVSAVGDITTNKVPEIIQVWAAPVQLASTGKWVCEHQGKLYFNFRNLVVELVMQEDKPTITRYNPSPPWYRLSYYSYINGLTSDGQTLYCSLNNFGISAYNGQGWHLIAEFYEQVAVENQSSGLRWLPDPTGAPDYLFCGDGRTLLKIPIPNVNQPYTSQVYQNHQNKCGYFITPEWTGNLADLYKNMRAVVLRAVPNGWSYKLVAACKDSVNGQSPSFRTMVEKSFHTGLMKDSWVTPFISASGNASVATTQLAVGHTAVPNTLAPACWVAGDFNNAAYQSQKLTVRTTDTTTTPPTTETVSNPVKLVKTQFILYFWNPAAGQAATTGVEVMSVDAVDFKHLPKQKYVARYGISLDLKALAEIGTVVKGVAAVNTSTKWLRDQAVAGDPLQFKFYDITGAIKTVNGIIQGFHGEALKLDKGQTKVFPLVSQFSILSLDEEESIYG